MIPIEHPRLRGFNPLDWITMAYFGITGIVLATGLDRIPGGVPLLLLHVGIVAGIALLGFLPRRGNLLVQFFRDTYPLWALPLLYQEVGILNQVVWPGSFDHVVIRWELALFGLYPSRHLAEWFPFPLLNEGLHFSYMTYYALVPVLGLWLYLRGRWEVCRVFATTVMMTFLTCYLIFIFFPVEGPHYVLPRVVPENGLFPPLVHRVLESGASRGAAFPSSHVAGAVAVLWMTARFERPLVPLMGLLCAGIFFGTVYGGFHYAVDALAGLALGIAISIAGPRIHSWMLRRARLEPLRIRFPDRFRPLMTALWRFRRPIRVRPVPPRDRSVL
ncbi:MAG: phosphatase PAP2 family protein [Candidatus Eisenbacteria bacterium]|nr:phosphatase PAP2 family protein [Candidatus Latescibacterota bacterium]MBD3302826.1 phosphatase PAP2 family protein [Candidatus Eisenbacteria bacterium]